MYVLRLASVVCKLESIHEFPNSSQNELITNQIITVHTLMWNVNYINKKIYKKILNANFLRSVSITGPSLQMVHYQISHERQVCKCRSYYASTMTNAFPLFTILLCWKYETTPPNYKIDGGRRVRANQKK